MNTQSTLAEVPVVHIPEIQKALYTLNNLIGEVETSLELLEVAISPILSSESAASAASPGTLNINCLYSEQLASFCTRTQTLERIITELRLRACTN